MILKKCFGNKKAVLDSIYIAVGAVMFMLMIVFTYMIMSNVNTTVQSMDSLPTVAKTASNTLLTKMLIFDTVFIVVWLLVFLSSMISAYFIDTHPAFFIFSIIVLIAIMVGIVPLANVNESILSSSQLSSTVVLFPKILFFAQHFFVIMLIQSFAIIMALYGKMRTVY